MNAQNDIMKVGKTLLKIGMTTKQEKKGLIIYIRPFEYNKD